LQVPPEAQPFLKREIRPGWRPGELASEHKHFGNALPIRVLAAWRQASRQRGRAPTAFGVAAVGEEAQYAVELIRQPFLHPTTTTTTMMMMMMMTLIMLMTRRNQLFAGLSAVALMTLGRPDPPHRQRGDLPKKIQIQC